MTSLRWGLVGALAIAALAFAFATRAEVGRSPMAVPADGFAADNRRAMDKMMAAMDTQPTGDADRDFVASMVPHHQGAIDMAVAELRYGKDETLRRMAQEIIVEQKQEIEAMTLAASRLPDSKTGGPVAANICRRAVAPKGH